MKLNSLILIGSLATLTACGAKAACEDYVAAVNDCNAEYADSVDGAVTVDIDDSACEDAEEGKSEFQCMADAYNNADCTTAEGFGEIATELSACAE